MNMGATVDIEKLQLEAKSWFSRGIHRWRTAEEADVWIDAVESGVFVTLESVGYTSQAVYQANRAVREMERYIKGELMGLSEYLE